MVYRQRDLPSAYYGETAGWLVEADSDQSVGKIESRIVDEILVTEARTASKSREEIIRKVSKHPTARGLRRAHLRHEPATHHRGTLLAPRPGVRDGPAVAHQMHDAKVRKREQAQKNGVGQAFG